MQAKIGSIALMSLGFALYRSAASYFYSSGMGLAETSVGFVSDTGFVLVANLVICIFAAVILLASRKGFLRGEPLPQWPVFCLVAIGAVFCELGPVLGLSYALSVGIAAVTCGITLPLLTCVWLDIFTAQEDPSAVLMQIALGDVGAFLLGLFTDALPGHSPMVFAVVALLASAGVVKWQRVSRGSTNGQRGISVPADERFSMVSTFVSFSVLVGVVGIMHTSVLGSASESLTDAPMWVARLVSLIVFLILVYPVGRGLSMGTLFKFVFPVLVAVLSLLPFLGDALGPFAGTIAIVCYQTCGMLFYVYLVREGRRLGLASPFLASLYLLGSSGCLLVGLLLGLLLNTLSASFGLSLLTLLAFAAIYPLVLSLMFALRRGRGLGDVEAGESIHQTVHVEDERADEAFDQRSSDEAPRLGAKTSPEDGSDACVSDNERLVVSAVSPTFLDKTALTTAIAQVAQQHSLTRREREILGYLVSGRSVRYIAETLVISENTAWTHAKHIYAKTGVHGKEELMDLVAAVTQTN